METKKNVGRTRREAAIQVDRPPAVRGRQVLRILTSETRKAIKKKFSMFRKGRNRSSESTNRT